MTQHMQVTMIDPNFLRLLSACNPEAAVVVKCLQEEIEELQCFGWSIEEIIIAAQTGYDVERHLVSANWRYGYDSHTLDEWLRNRYEHMKGASVVSFEEFVAVWRQLSDELNARRWYPRYKYTSSEEVMRWYIKARRVAGLPDEEARSIVLYRREVISRYLHLRRKGLRREFVTRVISTWRNKGYALPSQYVHEARKRGASEEDVLESIEAQSVRALALSLRFSHS